jgi:hypothetical protein
MKTEKFSIMFRVVVLCSVLAVALCGAAQAQLDFDEVSAAVGIKEYLMESGVVGGVAAADFDNDNDIDLFVPNGDGKADQLYRNSGAGQFQEIAVEAGVASTASQRAALWVDYDGDSRLDLIVVGDCFRKTGHITFGRADDDCVPSITVYHQNEQGTFDDRTDETGIVNPFGEATDPDGDSNFAGISAGDINNDGYLDLVFAVWDGTPIVLLNDGDGTFTDISASSNIGAEEYFPYQTIMHDFNGDGFLDIHAAVDRGADRLYINQGNNTFLDVAASAGVDHDENEMGITLGDYDNDGDLDMYVTNIDGNLLYRNDSSGGTVQFQELAVQAGVAEGDWGWGCAFMDADNDGLVDLAVTNGFYNGSFAVDRSRFFRNLGGEPVTFGDVSNAVKFNDSFLGYTLIAIDYDRDGHLDLVQTTQATDDVPNSQLRVMRNEPDESAQANNFVVIKPRMDGPNHFAIGATVHVRVGTVEMMRIITAGTSFIGQEPAEAHFGLADATIIDEVRIEWPGGGSSQFENIAVNRIYTARTASIEVELSNLDLDADGLEDEQEVLIHGTDPTQFDTDGDGASDGVEVTFGSDPLNADDAVSLPSLGFLGLGLLSILLGTAAVVLTKEREAVHSSFPLI